jgi:hypothetical protein
MVAFQTAGPEVTAEDAIRIRYWAGFDHLNLVGVELGDDALAAIPDNVVNLALAGTGITDASVVHLLRLTKLARLNLSGTVISDAGLDQLAALGELVWLNVERTQVAQEGIERLKASLPNLQVVH